MKRLIPIIIVLLTIAACENDIDLNPDKSGGLLTLNGYIEADTTRNALLVSLTDRKEPIEVNDAVVEVRVNGQLQETAAHDDSSYHRNQYLLTTPFHAGDRVRIDVKAHNQHAYVEETVPMPLSAAPTMDLGAINTTTFEQLVKISLNDNASEQNFYKLELDEFVVFRFESYESWTKSWRSSFFFQSGAASYDATADPILMDGHTYTPDTDFDLPTLGNIPNKLGVFPDRLFNGRNATLNVVVSWYPYLFGDHYDDNKQYHRLYSVDLRATIHSLTAAEYYYLKALNLRESDLYDDNSDLTGPMKMPSNVHGGTGLVGFRSKRTVTLPVRGNDRYPGLY